MRIGIDITPLQSPHRLRGIGATVVSFINNLSPHDKKLHHFVFFVKKDPKNLYGNPIDLLNLKGVNYEIIVQSIYEQLLDNVNSAPTTFTRLIRSVRHLKGLLRYYIGDARNLSRYDLDTFLQFDQQHSLPKGRRLKKCLVVYDIIPYILEADYLCSYKTSRRKGHSRKGSLRNYLHRWLYVKKLKLNAKRAYKLLAISEQTKSDLENFLGINPKKIVVTPLGIDSEKQKTLKTKTAPQFTHFIPTSWGYMERSYEFDPDVPFLLFVGGVDHRRKLKDLITAFNHLRGQGRNIKLLLVGDIMQGPEKIPIPETRRALEYSSYLDDIVFMGFVPDKVREVLYQKALAFVYPSVYEGFGLPVLEAMGYGCPVICYENGAVREVANGFPLYAKDAYDIIKYVDLILSEETSITRQEAKDKMIKFAHRYNWSKTATKIIDTIT